MQLFPLYNTTFTGVLTCLCYAPLWICAVGCSIKKKQRNSYFILSLFGSLELFGLLDISSLFISWLYRTRMQSSSGLILSVVQMSFQTKCLPQEHELLQIQQLSMKVSATCHEDVAPDHWLPKMTSLFINCPSWASVTCTSDSHCQIDCRLPFQVF